jgi:hypothetical protein
MSEARHHEVWIGLVEVRQRPGAGVMLDRNEAFTNALARANDQTSYRQAVEHALDELGFDLVSIEDAEPLRERVANFEVAGDLLELAGMVEIGGAPRFGEFHTWRSDDES